MEFAEHYLLKNENEKYDIIPEIWEGHNIADFVCADIKEKFEKIREEEEVRIKSGLAIIFILIDRFVINGFVNHPFSRYYDLDLEDDDDETRQLLENAKRIREKEDLLKMVVVMNLT